MYINRKTDNVYDEDKDIAMNRCSAAFVTVIVINNPRCCTQDMPTSARPLPGDAKGCKCTMNCHMLGLSPYTISCPVSTLKIAAIDLRCFYLSP